jgi:hypothetical protein
LADVRIDYTDEKERFVVLAASDPYRLLNVEKKL